MLETMSEGSVIITTSIAPPLLPNFNNSTSPATAASATEAANLAALAEARRPLISAVIFAELASFLPMFAVSIYVLRVMCTTSILHLNLRLLFVWQSVAAMLFAVGRLCTDAVNLFAAYPLYPYIGSLPEKFLIRFSAVSNIMVTPVLVAERIVATRYVDSYEHGVGGVPQCTLYALMLVALSLAAGAALKDIIDHIYRRRVISSLTMGFYLVNVVAGLAAYMILLLILRHNERSYKEDLHKKTGQHSLSKRYQLSENIRASRQLLPVIMFHVLLNLPPCVFIYLAYVGAMSTPLDFVTNLSYISLITCWFNLALLTSIIMFHPMLRREALTKLRNSTLWRTLLLQWCCRVNRSIVAPALSHGAALPTVDFGTNHQLENGSSGGGTITTTRPSPQQRQHGARSYTGLKTIDGRELIPRVGDPHAEHFKNLAEFWALREGEKECYYDRNPKP